MSFWQHLATSLQQRTVHVCQSMSRMPRFCAGDEEVHQEYMLETVQERSAALNAAGSKVAELEARVAEAAENAAQLTRDTSDLEATLSTLQKTLGAEDPKVQSVVNLTPSKVYTFPMHNMSGLQKTLDAEDPKVRRALASQ